MRGRYSLKIKYDDRVLGHIPTERVSSQDSATVYHPLENRMTDQVEAIRVYPTEKVEVLDQDGLHEGRMLHYHPWVYPYELHIYFVDSETINIGGYMNMMYSSEVREIQINDLRIKPISNEQKNSFKLLNRGDDNVRFISEDSKDAYSFGSVSDIMVAGFDEEKIRIERFN